MTPPVEEERTLSAMEIEAFQNVVRGEDRAAQKVMVSVMDTKLLIDELKRREEVVNLVIETIKDFSSNIRINDDILDKQAKIKDFKKDLRKVL